MTTTSHKIQFTVRTVETNSLRVEILVESKPGSSNHREVILGRLPTGSAVLADFVRRAEEMRSERQLTVRERAVLLRELLQRVRKYHAEVL